MSVFKICLSMVLGTLTYWLGGYDMTLKTLLALTIIDYITGITTAFYKHRFKASICLKGIIKKIYMYITVALAVIVQKFTGDIIPLRETVLIFYIVTEGLSCVENIGKVIPYPEKLKEVFAQLGDNKNE